MRELGWVLVLMAIVAVAACSSGGEDTGDDGGGSVDVPLDATGGVDGGLTDAGGVDTAAGGQVVVNEVLPRATDGGPDWVELHNPGDAAIDLAGWVLSDNDDAHAFALPDGTTLAPGAFLVVTQSVEDGDGGFDFGFGGEDAVRLFDPDGVLVEHESWVDGAVPDGLTWGRYPDGSGAFATLTAPTPGAPNAALAPTPDVVQSDVVGPDVVEPPDTVSADVDSDVGAPDAASDVVAPDDVEAPPAGIVVNELLASPVTGTEDVDWVELYNDGDDTVDVTDWILRDDDDAHEFRLPLGTALEPGDFVVFFRDESGAGAGFDFGLGASDMVRLYAPNGVLVDQTAWLDGQAPEGLSWGRHPDGWGAFATLPLATPNAPNAAPAR